MPVAVGEGKALDLAHATEIAVGNATDCTGSHGLSPDGKWLAITCITPSIPGAAFMWFRRPAALRAWSRRSPTRIFIVGRRTETPSPSRAQVRDREISIRLLLKAERRRLLRRGELVMIPITDRMGNGIWTGIGTGRGNADLPDAHGW